MFIAVLFTIVKRWKQPKCPSMDEWINKLWSIHAMRYIIQSSRGMKFWYMLQVGWNWATLANWNEPVTEGQILYDYIYIKYLELVNQTNRTQNGGCQGLGEEEIGNKRFIGKRFYFEVMKMLWNYLDMEFVQHSECSKCHWIVHFKYND